MICLLNDAGTGKNPACRRFHQGRVIRYQTCCVLLDAKNFWHPAKRNKSDSVLRALGESGGMLGFSLYPHHLKDKSHCSLDSFCEMIARTADLMGVSQIGLGSDLCQDQPDSVVEWMRVGRWTKTIDYGEGSAAHAGFPDMPDWFQDNRHFGNIAAGLRAIGFSNDETSAIMGENWLRFYDDNFTAA